MWEVRGKWVGSDWSVSIFASFPILASRFRFPFQFLGSSPGFQVQVEDLVRVWEA
jgi:hypothetical protein